MILLIFSEKQTTIDCMLQLEYYGDRMKVREIGKMDELEKGSGMSACGAAIGNGLDTPPC